MVRFTNSESRHGKSRISVGIRVRWLEDLGLWSKSQSFLKVWQVVWLLVIRYWGQHRSMKQIRWEQSSSCEKVWRLGSKVLSEPTRGYENP